VLVTVMVKFPLALETLVATRVHWLNGRARFVLASV
jgi:hypothetical protein